MTNKPTKRCSTSLVIREIQIKATRRSYFIPTKMAIIKKIENNKCWQGCGKIRTLKHVNGIVTLENSLAVAQKVKPRVTT